eukprot:g1012.t1
MGAGHSQAQIRNMRAEQIKDVMIMNGWSEAAQTFHATSVDGRGLLAMERRGLLEMGVGEKDATAMLHRRELFLKHSPTITRAAVCKWSSAQVCAMLRLNHLGQYSRAFEKADINGGLLLQLRESIGQPGEFMTQALDVMRLQSVLTYYVTK